jgi:hypothetical protein
VSGDAAVSSVTASRELKPIEMQFGTDETGSRCADVDADAACLTPCCHPIASSPPAEDSVWRANASSTRCRLIDFCNDKLHGAVAATVLRAAQLLSRPGTQRLTRQGMDHSPSPHFARSQALSPAGWQRRQLAQAETTGPSIPGVFAKRCMAGGTQDCSPPEAKRILG